MTYNVFGGTLNLTQSINRDIEVDQSVSQSIKPNEWKGYIKPTQCGTTKSQNTHRLKAEGKPEPCGC